MFYGRECNKKMQEPSGNSRRRLGAGEIGSRGTLRRKALQTSFLFAEFFESDYIQKSLRYPPVRKKGISQSSLENSILNLHFPGAQQRMNTHPWIPACPEMTISES
jgi:hypothetical protein